MKEKSGLVLKIWGGVLLVFALGAVTGAALNGLLASRAAKNPPNKVSMQNTPEYFETLKREVNLTSEQEAKMHAILDEMRDKYKGVCAEARPRYSALREDARIRIRQLLTPEQQERFDLIVTQDDCKCPEQAN